MFGKRELKAGIAKTFRKMGYEIRKAPSPGYRSVQVFDLAIHYLLATRGTRLSFIEVGANDGLFGDPLREYIVNYPWTGVLIEPQPNVFERLKENYAGYFDRLSFENVAISPSRTPLVLYRLAAGSSRDGRVVSAVASSNAMTTAKQLGIKPARLEKISVATARLDEIIEKHRLSRLDVLQLDTEGFEWPVLQTLDLAKNRPALIRFEHGHMSPQAISEITKHLNTHGYALYFGGYESDSVALREDFLQQVPFGSTCRPAVAG